MCLYDFKYPAQTKRAVAYAMKRGYTVRVFAPGFPESETCNPLDLIKDEEDAIAAGQLAQVVNKNFSKGNAGGGDKFFEEAGDSLVEGILLVTKAVGRNYHPLLLKLTGRHFFSLKMKRFWLIKNHQSQSFKIC